MEQRPIPDERGGHPDRRSQPFVRIDDDRVGEVEAVVEIGDPGVEDAG